jgi:paraquat-inducible protein A
MKSLMACHECDLLQRLPPVPEGRVALCSRCGAVLFRPKRNSVDRTLALNLTGILLYAVAVSFPFLALKTQGFVREAALLTGMKVLYQQGMSGLALVVILTCILFPLIEMLSLLYILLPLKFGRKLPGAVVLFHSVQVLKPWGMMEVFMLGILVSMVKLAKMATIIPGTALWAFVLLIFVLAGSTASLDSHLVWEKLDRRP